MLRIVPHVNVLMEAASSYQSLPFEFKRAVTLAIRFVEPDWSPEHVLAWISIRNFDKLTSLVLHNGYRPAWYGQRYRSGLVDQISENQIREALITETLIGYEGSQPIVFSEWHERSLLSPETVWFRRDQILTLWPEDSEQSEQTAQTTDAASAVRFRVSSTNSTPSLNKKSQAVHPQGKRGLRPWRTPQVKREMERDIESGKLTLADLRGAKQESLCADYQAGRYAVCKAREQVVLEAGGDPI